MPPTTDKPGVLRLIGVLSTAHRALFKVIMMAAQSQAENIVRRLDTTEKTAHSLGPGFLTDQPRSRCQQHARPTSSTLLADLAFHILQQADMATPVCSIEPFGHDRPSYNR